MSAKDDKPVTSRAAASTVWPVGALFRLSFVQLLGTRRALLYGVLLLLPPVFSLYVWLGPPSYSETLYLWGIIFVVAYLGFVVPFTALFYGTMLIRPEHEAHTLTYLVTRPVPRWLTVLVKYVSAAVVCVVGVTVSMLVAYVMLGLEFGMAPVVENFRYWFRLAGVSVVALLVYLALFLFVGVRFRRPVIVAVVFIVVWEGLVGLIPGIIRFATVTHYLRSLAIRATQETVMLPRYVTVKTAPLGVACVVLAALWAAMLGLSLGWFARAEFHTNPDRK